MNLLNASESSLGSFVKPSIRELQHTVLQWSQDRIQTTKTLVIAMLRLPELQAFEVVHLKAAREALEKAAFELSRLQ
jgi:hypothetical protein